MKKTNYLRIFTLICSFLFVSKNGFAQADLNSNAKTKTVVYKIARHSERDVITGAQAVEIDNLFASKKGIISSKTNAATRLTTVVMTSDFPEGEVKKLYKTLHVEIESLEITDPKK